MRQKRISAFTTGSALSCLMIVTALNVVITLATCRSAYAQQNQPGNFDPGQGQNGPATRASAGGVQAHSARDDKAGWSPTDFARADPKLPTLVIAGDSTASTGNPTHRGWAAPLIDYFDTTKVNVINRAIGGRSFRTFYGEGAWQKVVDGIKPGDYVVIEFGHNDSGNVGAAGGRADLPGVGEETKTVTRANNTTETVHTYGWYLRKFIQDVKAKHATPIVSSTTVRNVWTNGKVERGMGHMLAWARQVAADEKVAFIDHSNITADLYEKMGRENVARFFPADHTHTSTDGSVVNAETFIAGLKALPDMPLVDFLNEKGKKIEAHAPPAAQ